MSRFTALHQWLEDHAAQLDAGDPQVSAELLPQLASAGLFRLGVPTEYGGAGGSITEAIEALASVAERSLTAAFVGWGQRTFIEYLLTGRSAGPLREQLLPGLLSGEIAGASGLSNAMKFLSGIEQISLSGRPDAAGWTVDGALPWVTNLRTQDQGFWAAAMVAAPAGSPHPLVAVSPAHTPGLTRTPDLDLVALRGSATAQLRFEQAQVAEHHVLDPDAADYLPRVRPAFLGLQLALPLGLASRSLAEARARLARFDTSVLHGPVADTQAELDALSRQLHSGLAAGKFVKDCAELFRLKVALVETASRAVDLELQATGGLAYLSGRADGLMRRWREQAFLPLITPSVVQLQTQLAQAGQPYGGTPARQAAV
ncbi:acyl-CoA dehydrogenase (plasmid) [Deinococcus proteolyticus MRP]|uniref:Acyl-CoA dehydrogenase n=1 Tax=Deinococcus proteolyticus (strain ATCC 35074 / DSM 20540 / JCM 6276 / NBRC 101906 / NCIMB 13154 / VKM Ac-1939 / CCM 2703 / MRP) TaxID=693977 RepID=F0RRC5_DEIPM|nr:MULTISPECIES: acyl-CoA dehydrogenase family protein [Deinococcus]ADY27834.1 acyl-CoA dehydrogenase [Deinococcus proteolyticus MRP]MCY1703954.1 acyl-CoA/acyl-ACP dehydrogenase [Deinococcus sp. SL84]